MGSDGHVQSCHVLDLWSYLSGQALDSRPQLVFIAAKRRFLVEFFGITDAVRSDNLVQIKLMM